MKNVLVTGASRGIGLEIAKKYFNSKYNVITTSTSKWNVKSFEPIDHFIIDFNNGDFDLFLKKISTKKIDILINNAGINKINPFTQIDPLVFQKIQNINLFAPFRICQTLVPNMLKNQWGRIVNLSSIWGKRSKEFRAGYSASKFAIDGLTVALAIEHGKSNILSNCVAPGFINTELTKKILSKDEMQLLEERVPCKRFGSPEEVAALVFWLGSEENTYVNGQNIAIDGGYSRG